MPEVQIPVEIQTLVQSATDSAALVSRFQITDAVTYEAADTALRELKSLEKTVKAKLDFLKAPSKEAIARLDEFFKPGLLRITEAKQACDRTMTGYRDLQRKLAAEEEARQREIANRERARLEAQAAAERAEAERKAAEKQRKADELEAAGKAGRAAKARAQAESLVEAAETKAADLETVAASVPPPIVQANIPKIKGSYGRSKGWGARERKSSVDHPNGQRKLTSLEVLILAVAEAIATGGAWPETKFLTIDQKALDSRADDLKEDFNIPGYEAYWKGETTVSRKR